jgi:hypothetical protein
MFGSWERLIGRVALACCLAAITGCTSMRVKVSGDRGVRYQAAWTTPDGGTVTRAGTVPETFTFKSDVTGWFQNSTGEGEFRVRVYEGMGILVDEILIDSGRRVVIERQGRGVSYRIE